MAARLADRLTTYDLEEPFQSAYRPRHSVESAIIRVQSDILQAMDSQRVIVLVMLDLSARSTPLTTRCCCNASPVTWCQRNCAPLVSELPCWQETVYHHQQHSIQAADFRVLVSLRAQPSLPNCSPSIRFRLEVLKSMVLSVTSMPTTRRSFSP